MAVLSSSRGAKRPAFFSQLGRTKPRSPMPAQPPLYFPPYMKKTVFFWRGASKKRNKTTTTTTLYRGGPYG